MKDVNRPLLLALIALLGFGLVQVYSSSYIFAIETFNNGLYFFYKQGIAVTIGVVVLLIATLVRWKNWDQVFLALWAFAGLALIATLIPGVGVKVGGARRWLSFGFLRFEPSELVKILVPWLFAFIYSHWNNVGHWSKRPHAWFLWVLPLIVLLFQPDFGSFSIVILLILILLFIVGFSWRYFLWTSGLLIPAFAFLILRYPYRLARIAAFLNPWSDPSNSGFQLIQSLLSVRNGGFWGQGAGAGQGKLFFLPEAHTDFTLAVFAEEMGFLGVMILFTIYGFIFLRTLQIGYKIIDEKQKIFVFGAATLFALNTLLNMAVVLGMLPTKGLALPFLSYGGSSLLCYCFLFGWILNIDKQDSKDRHHAY